ncbi:MAG TPA: GNAT family N-acetyltransferase [Candidatus Limnocylindrales bacterium]|nr:GNAT family N-acetyltransferase [Candidatus Limnocylindrales bacterium]
MAEVTLSRERPDHPDAEALVLELEEHLAARYPAESRHGFSVQQLVDQGVHFFVLRDDGAPAACGGILFVEDDGPEPYGEIKRMYARGAYRGKGYGRRVLARLLDHARERGVTLVRLETGLDQVEAIGLYESMGFRRCPPFGPYRDDPLSPTYELRIPAA